jgi:hypothetical protein
MRIGLFAEEFLVTDLLHCGVLPSLADNTEDAAIQKMLQYRSCCNREDAAIEKMLQYRRCCNT